LSLSSGTASGTSELNGADNGVFGVDEFDAIVVEVADLESLAKAEVVDVNDYAFGDVGVDSFNFELLHRESQFTTGFNTFGVAFELNGNVNNDGFLVVDFEEVHVEHGVFYGVELYFAKYGFASFTVDVEFNDEYVGSIEKFANVVGVNLEVGGDEATAVAYGYDFFACFEGAGVGEFDGFATVKYYGDFFVAAEVFGGFLAEYVAGFGVELVRFHCCCFVLLKIKIT
jgi:hypothetical protein